jgi:hypothetical protein
MDVAPATRNKLVRSVIALTRSAEHDERTLSLLLDLCSALSDYANDDDYSVAHDLQDYVEEALRVARGNGDGSWRDELLEALELDMKSEDL